MKISHIEIGETEKRGEYAVVLVEKVRGGEWEQTMYTTKNIKEARDVAKKFSEIYKVEVKEVFE